MKSKLYYIYDPMCSWCYAFKNTFDKLREKLPENIEIINVVGGLASDSNEVMPKEMQNKIQSIWKDIEKFNGTQFNHDFWSKCEPKRSTYLACRAVLLAKEQNKEDEMIDAIQKAYYQEAKNPSELETILDLANKLKLDLSKFKNDLENGHAEEVLQKDLVFRRKLRVFSFPTLLLQYKKETYPIQLDFKDAKPMLKQIKDLSSNKYF